MSAASNRSGVGGNQRYRGGVVCPVCGGSEDDDRGSGKRCFGYIGGDRIYAHCTREEKAGALPQHPNSNTFAHKLKGKCKCGVEHGPAEPTSPRKSKSSKGPIEREYDYLDEAGVLLFQVVRYKSKDFMQRRPTGQGGWEWKLGNTRRVLYRLPELVAADPASPVYIVEGEKDVDNLRAIGLVATCNPMGQGKWRPEYNASLVGRAVHIIPDNDEVGREHAKAIALSVSGVAVEIKVIDLAETCREFGLGELPVKGDVSDFLKMGGTADCLKEAFVGTEPLPRLKVVRGDDQPQPRGKRPPESPKEKPVVEVNTRRYEVVEQSVEALRADPDLYRRGDFLVTVIREDSNVIHLTSRTTMENVEGSAKIVSLPEAVIGDHLTRHIDFIQWRKEKSGEAVAIPAHPPEWLIKTIAVRKFWPGIRPLVAVAECPFPRPDGTIVETPGYDQKTAVLYAPAMKFPPIPKAPNRDDAQAAWDRIKNYIRHFPFATENDRVVILAGMLAVLARHGIIGPVPGVAINGNKAGIGKGFLVDAMVIPGTGRIAPVSKYPYDEEEAGKVKTSIVRSGKTVVSFDNLREGSAYGGPDVDSLITARITDDRILGVSEQTGDLIVRLACFVNGNNIGPVNDAWRRWLVSNLETELEHPERRDDILDEDGKPEKDIDALMLENRGEIARDALTILRAHSLAGWPNDGWAPLGSFGDWDRVIRGAVWFATGRDCTATQQAAANDAPDHMAKLALLQGWRELPDGKENEAGVTAGEALKEVGNNPALYETLRGAMLLKAKGGKLPDSSALGFRLRAIKNTAIGGFRFRENGKRHGAVCWIVEEIRSKSQTPEGEGGEDREHHSAKPTRKTNTDSDIFTSGEGRDSQSSRVEVAPHPPHPPLLDIHQIRAVVGEWPLEWRERFNLAANRFAEEGHVFPNDEIKAFQEISRRIEGLNKTSSWD